MGTISETLRHIKTTLKQSAYTRWIKTQYGNLLISISISGFLTILSYPGILYSDSYERISFADGLKMSFQALLSGDSGLHSLNSWLTVTPSFFILLSKELVGSIVLYTFVQCLVFWFFTVVYTEQLNKKITRSGIKIGYFYRLSCGSLECIMKRVSVVL